MVCSVLLNYFKGINPIFTNRVAGRKLKGWLVLNNLVINLKVLVKSGHITFA